MRGKPFILKALSWVARITPAGAGKTAKKRVRRRYTRDHPRGCGENFAEILSLEGGAGSPPRMRGKRWGVQNGWLSDRITPADAGKTLLFFGGQYVVRDHPRGCGENQTHPQTRQSKTGSPPRMRGKRFAFGQLRPRAGITPADAGKTRLELHENKLDKDHPRGCGENTLTSAAYPKLLGSPPRMRGKPYSACGIGAFRWITPADAGKTDSAKRIPKRA